MAKVLPNDFHAKTVPFISFGNDFSNSRFIGWGLKNSGLKAKLLAKKYKGKYFLLEDGFIRSLGLGVSGSPAFSIVEDDIGIYYDATVASKLEIFLNSNEVFADVSLLKQAALAIEFIKEHNLSKYNQAWLFDSSELSKNKKRVLVVAQTAGDSSLAYGLGNQFTTDQMIGAAVSENPGAVVYLKVHPDVLSGKKQSDIEISSLPKSIQVLSEDINPVSLLKQFDKIYTKTSQMGFEALMLGKSVVCFGMPFYAGWGLTDDRVSCARRVKKRTVEEVFAAAYILYSRYTNPFTFEPSSLEETMRFMTDTREKLLLNAGNWSIFGVSKWKRGFIDGFLGFKSSIKYINSLPELLSVSVNEIFSEYHQSSNKITKKILIWAASYNSQIENHFASQNEKVFLLEDGFLRSVGLGINHARPLSLVIDSRGMYYDCTKESDLEHILNFDEFDFNSIERAKELIKQLVALKLTKYNLKSKKQGEQACLNLIENARLQGKTIVLVPGQVESDASIKKGSPQIKSNLDLLQAVANKTTNAFIVYKPHPDVLTKLRPGEIDNSPAFCDVQVTDIDMADLLDVVDEIHTMTSLTGFEALLRGKQVVCYGLPFYAGWGLTQDVLMCERRQRKLSLEELVIGALIKYPTYCDPKTGHLIDVETAVELLAQQKAKGEQKLPWHKRVFRFFRLRVLLPIGLIKQK